MPIPNDITFTPFDQLPAASLNDMIDNDKALADGSAIDDLSLATTDLANPYKFSVYRNAGASTGSGTPAKLSFDTEEYDTNGNFASGTYTAPVSGFYRFDANIDLSTAATYLILMIYKNGSLYKKLNQNQASTGTAAWSIGGGTEMQLAANDTIEIYTQANGAATLAVGNAPIACFFTGHLISKT